MSVADLVKEHQVVVFSWVQCPYCVRAKEILKPIAKDMKVYEVETMSNGDALRKQLLDSFKHETVPAIFINGEFIGGCSDLEAAQLSGALAKMLAAE